MTTKVKQSDPYYPPPNATPLAVDDANSFLIAPVSPDELAPSAGYAMVLDLALLDACIISD